MSTSINVFSGLVLNKNNFLIINTILVLNFVIAFCIVDTEEASTSTAVTGNDCPIHCIHVYCNGITVGVQSLTGTLPSLPSSCYDNRKRTLEDRDMSSSTLPPHNNTDIYVLR